MSKSKAQTVLESLVDRDGKYIVADGKVYNNMSESLRVLLYHSIFERELSVEQRADYMAKLTAMKVDLQKSHIYAYHEDDKEPELKQGELDAMLRRYRDKDSFEVLGKAIEGIYRADVTGALNKELREMQGTPEGNQKAIALIDGLRDKGASNIAPAVPRKKGATAGKAAAIANQGLQDTANEKGAVKPETSTGNANAPSLG